MHIDVMAESLFVATTCAAIPQPNSAAYFMVLLLPVLSTACQCAG
jgi:hypothetical protein